MQNRPPEPESYFRPLEKFRLGDLEAIRLVLRGGSVIDWHRLYFSSRGEVDRFLRVNEFDPESPDDMDRLDVILGTPWQATAPVEGGART